MTLPATVAVDVGGTKIRAGSVIDGRLAHVRGVPTPATAGADAVLDTIAEVTAAVIADASGSRGTASDLMWRIGVGAAGVIDPASGIVISATDSLSGWAGTELTAELSARTGLPVRAVNDVHAHALGEARAGASRDSSSSLLVAVGTGIGGGFITDGRLLTGRNAAAGHIGHVPVAAAAGLACPCGGNGHVEAIASGPAILATYQRLVRDEDTTTSAQLGACTSAPADTRALAAAASAGDDLAVRAFDIGARALGSALGGIANVLSPEVIVVGGGLTEMDQTWWAPLRDAFAAELIPATAGLSLRKAELGQDAALIGAAGLWADGFAPRTGTYTQRTGTSTPRTDTKKESH
ncbi:ROK family protein [Brevibacterium oceani]|uniref:ROK family protein n=1 Tax=Brevibacterium oceani TaxID=358099 RepID=UPI001FE67C83|nr:ROK family protein [Brevibacterium oceani]